MSSLNSVIEGFIEMLILIIPTSIVVILFTYIFIKIMKAYNYFGNVISRKSEIENEMNKMEPYKIRNMMNELHVFKLSSFLTYLILLTGLGSFLLSVLGKQWFYHNIFGMSFFYFWFVLSSFLLLKYYNDAVLYSKEYFYKNFDDKTFRKK